MVWFDQNSVQCHMVLAAWPLQACKDMEVTFPIWRIRDMIYIRWRRDKPLGSTPRHVMGPRRDDSKACIHTCRQAAELPANVTGAVADEEGEEVTLSLTR